MVLLPSSTSMASIDTTSSGGDSDVAKDELSKSVQQFIRTFERRIEKFEVPVELQRAVLRKKCHRRPEWPAVHDCMQRAQRVPDHATWCDRTNDNAARPGLARGLGAGLCIHGWLNNGSPIRP